MFGIGTTIGKIFGTKKAIAAVIDNVSRGLDVLVYTNEEKVVDATKDRAVAATRMESTKRQNLARRLIALCIAMAPYMGRIVNSATNKFGGKNKT